jgi:hypothetical protein
MAEEEEHMLLMVALAVRQVEEEAAAVLIHPLIMGVQAVQAVEVKYESIHGRR